MIFDNQSLCKHNSGYSSYHVQYVVSLERLSSECDLEPFSGFELYLCGVQMVCISYFLNRNIL